MYTKIKNTLSALTVALSVVAFGFSLGEPASALPASHGLAAVASLDGTPDAVAETTNPAAAPAARRSQGLKRHLAMPFISFSPLLPRRGV